MNNPSLIVCAGILVAAALIVLLQILLEPRKPKKVEEPTVAEFNFDDWGVTIIDSSNTMFALCFFHPDGNLEIVHYQNHMKSGTRKFIDEFVINFEPSVVIRRTEDPEDNRYQISLPPGWRIIVHPKV